MLSWILKLFQKSNKVHQSHEWKIVPCDEWQSEHLSCDWNTSISPFFPFKKEAIQETAYFLALEDNCKEPPEHYWFLAEQIYDRNC